MIDEKVIYGGLSATERQAKKGMYWAYHIYKDLVALDAHLYQAKKECKSGELGTLAELDVPAMIAEAKRIAEIDWSKMPDMDAHHKVKWIQDGI